MPIYKKNVEIRQGLVYVTKTFPRVEEEADEYIRKLKIAERERLEQEIEVTNTMSIYGVAPKFINHIRHLSDDKESITLGYSQEYGGITLDELFNRGGLYLRQVYRLGFQMGLLVGQARDLGYLHCDLNPSNVVVDWNPKAFYSNMFLIDWEDVMPAPVGRNLNKEEYKRHYLMVGVPCGDYGPIRDPAYKKMFDEGYYAAYAP